MKIWNLFSDNPIEICADMNQIAIHIFRNFDKCIKLLNAIYGRKCIVCNELSPSFRTDSGLSEHYWTRHRKRTMEFIRDKILIKNPDQIREMIGDV